MAYSFDYRKRAIELLEEGSSVQELSKMLGLDRKTVYDWKKREERGELETTYPAR